MTNGRPTSRTGPEQDQSQEIAGTVGEAISVILKYVIGNTQGSLGGQLPGIMDEFRAALAPLQALRPDYGNLPRAQADTLRLVQAANSRADLSRAAPRVPKNPDNVAQEGARK